MPVFTIHYSYNYTTVYIDFIILYLKKKNGKFV